MKTNYSTLLYSAAFCMLAGFSSCTDETDLSGSLQEIQTISSITLDQTIYNADEQNLYMLPNQEVQLACTVLPEDADDKSVKWSSLNEAVATVSADGYVVSKSLGTTVIRVTPGIGFGPSATTPSFTINVVDHFNYIESITLKNADVLAEEGISESASYQVEVEALPATATFKRYKWESLNPDIATVDEHGVVTGVKGGNATIKVTADDFSTSPVSTVFTVKVNPVVQIEDFEFTADAKDYLNQLGYGEVYDLKKAVALTPSNATVELITWSSDNESVVSVDKDGILTSNGVKEGTSTITATVGDIAKTVQVTVAAGRLWYLFEKSVSPWYVKDNATFSSDGEKIRVTLNNGSGSLAFTESGSNGSIYLSKEYPILAVKIMLPYKVVKGNNNSGTFFLDTNYGRCDQKTSNGNNIFTIIKDSEYSGNIPTTPMICYFDLSVGFGGQDENHPVHNLPETGSDEYKTFQFGVYDFNKVNDHLGYYEVYWVRSFKTVEELNTFLAVEEANNNK